MPLRWRGVGRKTEGIVDAIKATYGDPLKGSFNRGSRKEWAMQEKTLVNRREVLEKMLPAFDSPSNKSSYPELLHLNQHFTGKPVFWLHGEGGGLKDINGWQRKADGRFMVFRHQGI